MDQEVQSESENDLQSFLTIRVNGKYKTAKGLPVTLLEYYPKMCQFQGKITERGRDFYSIWGRQGNSLEDPQWDITKEIK